jgi:hypothetical protein
MIAREVPIARCSPGHLRKKPMPLVVSDRLYVDAALLGKFGRRETFHAPIVRPYHSTEFKWGLKMPLAVLENADAHQSKCDTVDDVEIPWMMLIG